MCSFLVGLLRSDCLVGVHMPASLIPFCCVYSWPASGVQYRSSRPEMLTEGVSQQGILKEPDFPLHKAGKGQPTIKVRTAPGPLLCKR